MDIGGVKIQNQSVELAKTAAAQFVSGTGDGLLGLAFPSINTITKNGQSDPQNTPVANMISQGDIPSDAQLFTSAFYSARDDQAKSFYTFGYIDTDLVGNNTIHYTDIDNSEGFWMFDSATATIAGKKITQSSNKAIADTGTTLALLSDEVVDALYKQIPGAKYDSSYTHPPHSPTSYPPLPWPPISFNTPDGFLMDRTWLTKTPGMTISSRATSSQPP